MLFSLSMFPIGGGESILAPVAEVVEEIDRSGLPYQVTAMDTVIEGDWDEVLPVIQRAHERLRERYDRVFMTLAMDDHKGAAGRLRGAVAEVEARLSPTG